MPIRFLALPAIAAVLAVPAFADRAPNTAEMARIEASLRAAGYTSWEEVEFDDGQWEVDDAVARNGRTYDLKLHATSYRIVRRILD